MRLGIAGHIRRGFLDDRVSRRAFGVVRPGGQHGVIVSVGAREVLADNGKRFTGRFGKSGSAMASTGAGQSRRGT